MQIKKFLLTTATFNNYAVESKYLVEVNSSIPNVFYWGKSCVPFIVF